MPKEFDRDVKSYQEIRGSRYSPSDGEDAFGDRAKSAFVSPRFKGASDDLSEKAGALLQDHLFEHQKKTRIYLSAQMGRRGSSFFLG